MIEVLLIPSRIPHHKYMPKNRKHMSSQVFNLSKRPIYTKQKLSTNNKAIISTALSPLTISKVLDDLKHCICSMIWMLSDSMIGENIMPGKRSSRNNGIIFRWKQTWFFKHQTMKIFFHWTLKSLDGAWTMSTCSTAHHYPGPGLFM